MGEPLRAYLVATGPEDDAAYRALHDLAEILAGHPEARVIGGQMVGLIAAAFPSPGFIDRRTSDADGGITLELADDGTMHTENLLRRDTRPKVVTDTSSGTRSPPRSSTC